MRNAYDPSLVSALSNFANNPQNPVAGRTAAVHALAPLAKQTKPWNGKWWGTQPERNSLPSMSKWNSCGPLPPRSRFQLAAPTFPT